MQQAGPTQQRTNNRGEPDGRGGLPASAALPPWESFALAERHQVVRLLIQVARRQMAGGSAPAYPMGQGRWGRHDHP
jgi:hypothetical protein